MPLGLYGAAQDGFRKRVSYLLECPSLLHELGNVGMDDAIPLLGGLRFSYIAQTGTACTSRVT